MPRSPDFDRTPWNAGPGELPGDPENDPANFSQCDCCREMKPVDQIRFIPAGALGNSAGCDTYQCDECAEKARRDWP
jgi:hypothetical protein